MYDYIHILSLLKIETMEGNPAVKCLYIFVKHIKHWFSI